MTSFEKHNLGQQNMSTKKTVIFSNALGARRAQIKNAHFLGPAHILVAIGHKIFSKKIKSWAKEMLS